MSTLSTDELRWRAQDDARALAIAESVKSDPARLTAAKAALAKMIVEKEEETKGLKKAAGKSTTSTPDRSSRNNSTPARKSVVKTNTVLSQRPGWQGR